MAIVIEQINRSGQVLHTHVFNQQRVLIGRGFGCDLVLQDPHVDAQHLNIELDLEHHSLQAQEMRTTNGTWLLESKGRAPNYRRRRSLLEGDSFHSGQVFLLGQVLLRIYESRHAVPPAVRLSRWEAASHTLSHAWVFISAALALILLSVYDSYLSTPHAEDFYQHGRMAAYGLLGSLIYAGGWALVGKILRHEGHFALHLSMALLALVAWQAVLLLQPIWAYNLSLWRYADLLQVAIGALLTFVIVYVALYFSCNLGRYLRPSVALLPALVLLIPPLVGILNRPDFSPRPPYDRSLASPAWQLRASTDHQGFLEVSETLYQKAAENTADDS